MYLFKTFAFLFDEVFEVDAIIVVLPIRQYFDLMKLERDSNSQPLSLKMNTQPQCYKSTPHNALINVCVV